jgi:predicted ATPase/DNA-binding winged helix-turn-helix (wHTH) protein
VTVVLHQGSMTACDVISFGPYRLIPTERLLLRGAQAIEIGSRALDVLIALVEVAGEVVGRRELLARAWPGVVVGDGSLRVTIADLRRVLGDGQDGVRYIANVTGRGYCFVAPVGRPAAQSLPSRSPFLPSEHPATPKHNLPVRLARMIGRDGAVEALLTLVTSRRFVSVVGPGGLGKTTIAISVAHALLSDFGEAVYFVDLGAVIDPPLVPSAIAAVLGVFAPAKDPLLSLMAFLAGRRILLVLDNCEHVIDAAAFLTERLYNDAPQVHILTTSREALRAEGEHVHLLMPLECPVVRDDLTAAEALTSPAVQLFMERAFASGHAPGLTDADAPAVAAICSRLDGIALAIELAGSRVGAHGLQGTANLLGNRFRLLWQGRRTALPRHQTLHAMLDWSFNLLSERDRRVLVRISIFVGVFTLEAAQAVAVDDRTDAMEVADAITSLIDKSLIWVAPIEGIAHHRLLDSTLAFAAEKLSQTTEATALARQHALYYVQWCSSDPGKGIAASRGNAAIVGPHMSNIRAALEWSFCGTGDASIGVRLVAGSAPLFLGLSLLVECHHWCEQALSVLPEEYADKAIRLGLQARLAVSAMFTRGNSDEVRMAIENGLRLAYELGDLPHQLHLLAGLNIFLSRIGDFEGAMVVAQRSIAIAQEIGSSAAIFTGEWMLGVSYHLLGDQASAQRHCERGVAQAATSDAVQVEFFGYDHRIRGLVALARTLWLRGFPDRAARTARRAIDEAVKRDHPVNLCIALIYTATVFLWRGDFDEAEQLIRRLVAHAARYSLGPYHAVGLALTGELAIARADPAVGVPILRGALGVLQLERHHVLTPAFHLALSEGLRQSGEIDEAAAVLDAALARSEARAESSTAPELLRIRGEAWLQTTFPDPAAAERAFQLSLQRARAQSALSLELRSATGLARLWSGQGKYTDAADLLEPVYRRFSEGFHTKDLKLAGQLLAEIERRVTPLDSRSGAI